MIGGSDVFLFSKNASVWAPMDGKWLAKYKAASSSNRVELAQAQVCALNPAACAACAFNLPCALTAGAVIGGGYILWNETKETDKNDEGQRGTSITTPDSPEPDDEGEKKRKKNPEKAESKVWKELKNYKNDVKTNGKIGKEKRYYKWDYTHKDIEVYDHNGRHLGSLDPTTGEMYKGPLKGRDIKREL